MSEEKCVQYGHYTTNYSCEQRDGKYIVFNGERQFTAENMSDAWMLCAILNSESELSRALQHSRFDNK
jgi:hypothetical protein